MKLCKASKTKRTFCFIVNLQLNTWNKAELIYDGENIKMRVKDLSTRKQQIDIQPLKGKISKLGSRIYTCTNAETDNRVQPLESTHIKISKGSIYEEAANRHITNTVYVKHSPMDNDQ